MSRTAVSALVLVCLCGCATGGADGTIDFVPDGGKKDTSSAIDTTIDDDTSSPSDSGSSDSIKPDTADTPTCETGATLCSTGCADLKSDAFHCGTCDKICKGTETCIDGLCSECLSPKTRCGIACIDLNTDPKNCGTCGTVCTSTETCIAGYCTPCTGTFCSGVCVDTSTDASNCGTCGKVCAAGLACAGGVCTSATTVVFPQTTSKVYTGTTLGTGGGGVHYISGEYVEDSYARTVATTKLDLNFKMSDLTTGCSVGATLNWAVKLNGTTVGTYSFVSVSGGFGDRTITKSYSFASVAPVAGKFTIRLEATSTVCGGGSSWNWYPGGSAKLY